MWKRAVLVSASLLAGFSASASADIVHLKDGGKMEGLLVREGAGWVVLEGGGKRTFVGDDQVKSIEKTSSLSPAELSESRLGTLRRGVDALSDLDQIVERYSRFIEENKGQPAADEAKKDLDAWREKQNKGMVKVGSSWVTPQERQKMLEESALLVDDAREQIKSSRLRDAEATVNKLLTVDPKNASGLYLRGVLMFKQGNLGQAKKSFEMVKEQQVDHGPTLNNLGVVLSQQKQPMPALVAYDQAMQASPTNRQILDNVAEALEAIPQEQRKNSSYTRAAKRFAELDADMQKEMQKEGLHRWGSTWVDAKQMEELKAAQAKVKDKLDQLVADYDRIKERVKEIDTQMDLNDKSLQRMRNDANVYDRRNAGTGGGSVRIVRTPLPSIYYDIKRENDRLKVEQDGLLAKMETFADKERAIRQEVPVPEYTGKQRIIETEGTPLAAVDTKKAGPATRPVMK